MLKDLRLIQKAVETLSINMPIAEHATELYKKFIKEENGRGMEFTAILQAFEKQGRE